MGYWSQFCLKLLVAASYRSYGDKLRGLKLIDEGIRYLPMETRPDSMLAQTLLGDALNGLVQLQVNDPDTPEFLCTKFFDTYIDCLQGRVKDDYLSPTVDFTKRWLDDPQLGAQAVIHLLIPLLQKFPANVEIFRVYEHVVIGHEEDLATRAMFGLSQLQELNSSSMVRLLRVGFDAARNKWTSRKTLCTIAMERVIKRGMLDSTHLHELRDGITQFADNTQWDNELTRIDHAIAATLNARAAGRN